MARLWRRETARRKRFCRGAEGSKVRLPWAEKTAPAVNLTNLALAMRCRGPGPDVAGPGRPGQAGAGRREGGWVRHAVMVTDEVLHLSNYRIWTFMSIFVDETRHFCLLNR